MATSVTFVCVVESGPLEGQTVRLVESLRRHGGRFAGCDVVAVTPRLGPPLASGTRRDLARLGAEHLHVRPRGGRAWFPFYNKPVAMAAVEARASTDLMAWLDSDLLVLREPEGLDLRPDVDFVAVASDKEMGSTGPADPFDPLWQVLCDALGVRLDDLPWVVNEMDATRVRLYWNGGLFAYRRASGFGAAYLDTCERLLASRVASTAKGYALGIDEMAAIGLAQHVAGLRFRALPFTHNYPMGSTVPGAWYSDDRLRDTRILHHHDMLWEPWWPRLVSALERVHPEVARWLVPMGPLRNTAPLPHRAFARILKSVRARQLRAYLASCRTVAPPPVAAADPRAAAVGG